jgi:hypothetical protein
VPFSFLFLDANFSFINDLSPGNLICVYSFFGFTFRYVVVGRLMFNDVHPFI